jgi:hypothetical protein
VRGPVSCRVHAASCTPRPRHATPTEVRKRKKKKKQGAGGCVIHSFILHIPSASQFRSLQREGVYDVTSASLCFLKSRPSPLSAVKIPFGLGPSVAVSMGRQPNATIMGLAQSGNYISYLLHPFSHEGFTSTQRSATQASHPFRCEFFGGRPGTRGAKGREVLSLLSSPVTAFRTIPAG